MNSRFAYCRRNRVDVRRRSNSQRKDRNKIRSLPRKRTRAAPTRPSIGIANCRKGERENELIGL